MIVVGPERQPVGRAKTRHAVGIQGDHQVWVRRWGIEYPAQGAKSDRCRLSPDRCRLQGLQEGRSFAARKGSVREGRYAGRIQQAPWVSGRRERC